MIQTHYVLFTFEIVWAPKEELNYLNFDFVDGPTEENTVGTISQSTLRL